MKEPRQILLELNLEPLPVLLPKILETQILEVIADMLISLINHDNSEEVSNEYNQ